MTKKMMVMEILDCVWDFVEQVSGFMIVVLTMGLGVCLLNLTTSGCGTENLVNPEYWLCMVFLSALATVGFEIANRVCKKIESLRK